MRLDHLLSKEASRGYFTVVLPMGIGNRASGGDALMGDTRTHPEHDG